LRANTRLLFSGFIGTITEVLDLIVLNSGPRSLTPEQGIRLPQYVKWRYHANYHLKFTLSGAAMPEYVQAIERFLLDNPKLSKPALVELLTKRFSNLPADEAWTIVSRYFNKKA